jgi:hypothetical protein
VFSSGKFRVAGTGPLAADRHFAVSEELSVIGDLEALSRMPGEDICTYYETSPVARRWCRGGADTRHTHRSRKSKHDLLRIAYPSALRWNARQFSNKTELHPEFQSDEPADT